MADVTELNDALSANFMLVDVDISSWTGKETDREASRELTAAKGATKDAARVVKNLLANADEELEAVRKAAAALRAFVARRTLPFGKMQIIAATEAIEFLGALTAEKTRYDAAVLQLAAVWDERVAQAKQNLGTFDEGTYPSAQDIPTRFAVKVDLMPVPSQTDFSRMNLPAPIIEALGQRFAKQVVTTMEGSFDDLRARLLKQVERMVHVLGKAAMGERTKIYDTLTTELGEAVKLLRTINVTGKPELTALADRIERELLATPVTAFRESRERAAEVANAARSIAVDAAIEEMWKL